MVLGCSQVGVAGPAAVGNFLWLVIAPSPPCNGGSGRGGQGQHHCYGDSAYIHYIRHALERVDI